MAFFVYSRHLFFVLLGKMFDVFTTIFKCRYKQFGAMLLCHLFKTEINVTYKTLIFITVKHIFVIVSFRFVSSACVCLLEWVNSTNHVGMWIIK